MIQTVLATLLSFLVLDMLWINFVAVGLYKNHLSDFLLRSPAGAIQPNFLASGLFYVVAVSCLYLLAIRPAASIKDALFVGCVAGLFAYGTYALTGQALFKNWRWIMTVLDILWGVSLCGATACIGYYVKTNFGS